MNGNKLNDLSAEDTNKTFENMRVLVVNSIGLQSGYSSLKKLAKIFPKLVELYAAKNDFSDLVREAVAVDRMGEAVANFCSANTTSGSVGVGVGVGVDSPPPPPSTALLPNLKLIDLSDCGIYSWEDQVTILAER